MGYYGRSVYRGDFRAVRSGRVGGGIMRQGFHPAMLQRGDFLDDLGGVLGKVGGYIDKGLEHLPVVGRIVGAADKAFQLIAPHPALAPPSTLPALPKIGAGGGGFSIMPVGKPTTMRPTKNPFAEAERSPGARRRMNPLNVKALRRSLRRADGFMKVAKHFVKILKPGHHVALKHQVHHKKK